MVKIHDNNQIINKSLFLAIAVNMEGYKEVLGMWIARKLVSKILRISDY
ncbi:MAG: transposase [Rickettsiaceae bacterium]|nr:transposase [Rickettsiaceae bacterium]